ncbi:hypothetical protein IAT38_000447 [Cryptococcus sp. DSM 104549]
MSRYTRLVCELLATISPVVMHVKPSSSSLPLELNGDKSLQLILWSDLWRARRAQCGTLDAPDMFLRVSPSRSREFTRSYISIFRSGLSRFELWNEEQEATPGNVLPTSRWIAMVLLSLATTPTGPRDPTLDHEIRLMGVAATEGPARDVGDVVRNTMVESKIASEWAAVRTLIGESWPEDEGIVCSCLAKFRFVIDGRREFRTSEEGKGCMLCKAPTHILIPTNIAKAPTEVPPSCRAPQKDSTTAERTDALRAAFQGGGRGAQGQQSTMKVGGSMPLVMPVMGFVMGFVLGFVMGSVMDFEVTGTRRKRRQGRITRAGAEDRGMLIDHDLNAP